MSDEFLMWTEIIFDVFYLITIWILVAKMYVKRDNLTLKTKPVGILFLVAFFLLAFGDTGHVGFRVVAYAMGGLENNPVLVGIGKLTTTVTVTFFYMLVAEIWRIRFEYKRNVIWWGFMITGVARLIIMIPGGNGWISVESSFGWSIARNIPLMIQGIGVSVLLLRDSIEINDSLMKKISIWIFVSYACYLPVILFVHKTPLLGMLMMPKTLAYLAVAFIAFSLFTEQKQSITKL